MYNVAILKHDLVQFVQEVYLDGHKFQQGNALQQIHTRKARGVKHQQVDSPPPSLQI